nr:YfhO family protein [Lachnospiraceae bacterium]
MGTKECSKVNRSWKAYAWYSLFFAVLCFFVFLPFVQENRSLLWNPDAVVYHIPMAETFTEMLKTVLSGNVFGLYDLSVGMGTDMLQYTSQWYAEPLNLLYAFFGAKSAEKIYSLFIFVRLYLCGAMFLVFSELITENDRAAVSGALVYVFSGYTLFTGTKAAPFLVAMILLPLIFYTAEVFRKEKRAIWFMLVIAFSAVFSYYFLFMNSILLAVYVLIGVFARRDTARDAVCYITRLIGFYLVGLCMGCVTFLPSVAGFLRSSRSSGARNVKSLLHYDAEYYKDLVTGLFQARINHDYWLVLGFTPLLILALLFLIRQKDAIAARLKMAWTVLGIGVCVPLFGCVTNGGMVANNRWLYALVFVAGVTFAKAYPDLVKWLGSVFGGAKKAEKRCEVLWCTALILSLALGGNSLFADVGEGFAGEFHKLGSGYKTMTNNTNMKMAKVEDDALYRVDAARTPKTASSAWVAGDYRGLVTNASGYSKEMADFYRYF